jgi:hypothetical protein
MRRHFINKGDVMTLRQIVFGLSALLLAAPGIATAQVALMQPSDSIVAILSSGETCHGNGLIVGKRILPDGSVVPFHIPRGYAFMVTGVDYVTGDSPGGGTPTGDRIGYILRTVDSGVVIAEGYAVNTGAQGSVSGQTNLSTPMPVTSQLCLDRTVGGVVGGTRTWVRGFLFRYF